MLTVFCAGDGIYSLTITDYPAAGRYKFSVTAEDTGLTSFTAGQGGLRRPGPFRRTVFGAVVHLSGIPSEDVVPPSKIGDLLINSSDNKVQRINNISNNIPSPKLIP